jgi:penicillin G amidase
LLRLFGYGGLLTTISAVLALATSSLFFRLLTLVLGLTVLALYLWLRRSLPRRQGTVLMPGLKETVDVYVDDRGVRHVYANNSHDLYLAQGYVTAQDRLWTMDLYRRVASGQLAEVLGDNVLHLDRHFRTLGLRRAAEASLDRLSPETRAVLEAYATGVNARISEGRLPPEFAVAGYKPTPWTAVDTLTLGKYTAYYLVSNWDRELFRTRLVQTVGVEQAAELFWLPPDGDLLRLLEQLPLPDVDGLLNTIAATSHEVSGSNSWVAGGSKTRSGAPLLANDPHLAISSPSVWYQTHLVGPAGLDVTGATFPGVPGILLGHNRDIAWGATNFNADVQDIYVERCNPAASDEFLFADHWEKATHITEQIRVKGKADPIAHDVFVTRHGPVIARGGETALSVRWTALEPSAEIETFLAINQARSWAEFRQALEPYAAPAQQFLFAGRDGTIACRVAGKVPVRPRGDGQAPVPGWTGEFEWTGTVPFDAMPEVVNPPEGFLTAAACDTPTMNYRMGSGWLPPYRSQWVGHRLNAATDLTAQHMVDLQTDCMNYHARSLLQVLLNALQEGLHQGSPHAQALTATEKRAMLLLSGWDCCESAGAPAPLLWHYWYVFLLEGIFRPRMGLDLFDRFVASGMPMQVMDRLIHRVVEGGDSLWLDREGEGSLGRLALRAFRRAVALLAAKHGKQPDRWHWGKERTVTFEHPLASKFGPLRPFLNLGPYPVGGSTITVNNQGFSQLNPFKASVAATWRQVVDLGQIEEALDICAPGQSGHPLSPYHADQLAGWLKGEYQPQLVRHKAIRELPCLVLKPE